MDQSDAELVIQDGGAQVKTSHDRKRPTQTSEGSRDWSHGFPWRYNCLSPHGVPPSPRLSNVGPNGVHRVLDSTMAWCYHWYPIRMNLKYSPSPPRLNERKRSQNKLSLGKDEKVITHVNLSCHTWK